MKECNMKTKFSCASKKDNRKVTLQLAQLDNNPYDTDGVPRILLHRDSHIIVTIQLKRKTVEITFKPNRFNDIGEATTAATNAWCLRFPKVGKSVTYNVIGVMYV